MAYIYKNITGNTAEILLTKIQLSNTPIKAINMANIHVSDNVKVDLYLYNTSDSTPPDANNDWTVVTTTNTYYIVKNLTFPVNSTVRLEKEDLLINYERIQYDLYIKLSAADSAVDIIINN